jgi:MHS family shikimate/dehydroshikimate transporter-like MFS transporter
MTVEHSPTGKHGFYGSPPQIRLPAGLLVSTFFFGLTSDLPEQALLSWGWRVALVASIVLAAVALFLRLSVVEPSAFAAVKQTRTVAKNPVLKAVSSHPRSVLLVMGARISAPSQTGWGGGQSIFSEPLSQPPSPSHFPSSLRHHSPTFSCFR